MIFLNHIRGLRAYKDVDEGGVMGNVMVGLK